MTAAAKKPPTIEKIADLIASERDAERIAFTAERALIRAGARIRAALRAFAGTSGRDRTLAYQEALRIYEARKAADPCVS